VPIKFLPFLLTGAWMTLKISFISILLGLVIGTVGAACKTSGIRWLALIASGYVEFIRNTPFLIQIFFFYFGLPDLGVDLNPYQASILALTVNAGAYFTEIIRGGIQSVHKGEIEAAHSLGLTHLQTLLYIILPQAFRVVAPPIGNQAILLLLGSSVCSTITLQELTYNAAILESRTFRSFEIYFFTLGIYFIMAQILATSLKLITRKSDFREVGS
jgi:ectoine/hydroxyectoine ABC transporter permease protein EhuC